MNIKTIGLVIRGADVQAHKIATEFTTACLKKDIEVIVSIDSLDKLSTSETILNPLPQLQTAPLPEIGLKADITFVLGGDGTYLAAAAGLYATPCPLVGINLGHLGFLTDIPSEALTSIIKDILQNNFQHQQRRYYLATLYKNGKQAWQQHFLNDAVIQRNADDRVITFEAYVKEWQVAHARADGIMISTPTGSTAYNLSAGGPILHPKIEALIINPICPHNMAFRPVVVPPEEVTVTLTKAHGYLSLDGRKSHAITNKDKVVITQSTHTLNTIVGKNYNFFDVLREKFGWDRSKSTKIG